ncbi:hypothetical protein EDD99_2858 [Streptomyces sp. 846.5]|nr:hypothetical protein [Streptomyces sp. 846.5]TDU04399.1 hypothetical protein EDD99_2858 [Streptomyces sp. 846.5]
MNQPVTAATPGPSNPVRRYNRFLAGLPFGIAIVAVLVLKGSTGSTDVGDSDLLTTWFCAGLGGLIGMQTLIAVQLLLGRLGGMAPTTVFVGAAGRRLGSTRIGGVDVDFRAVPLLPVSGCMVVVDTPAARVRLWLGQALGTGVTLALGLALLLRDPGMGAVSWIGAGVTMIAAGVALTAPSVPGTRAWFLWRMPFDRKGGLADLSHDAASLAASRRLLGGHLGDARAALAGAARPDSVPVVSLRASIALGLGEYRDAALLARLALERSRSVAQRSMLAGIHSRAAAYELEAGTLPPEVARPAMEYALTLIKAEFPQLLRIGDLPATVELLNGRAAQALPLARRAVRRPTDVQTTAYGLCTLAAAEAVTGDRAAATTALARARRLMPELARIAVVEQRLAELGPAAPVG